MDPVSLYKAAQLIICRARVYRGYGRKYYRLDIKVWTKSLTDLDLLERIFGGEHYIHRSGWYWILCKKEDQLRLLELVHPWLTSENSKRLNLLIAYAVNEIPCP